MSDELTDQQTAILVAVRDAEQPPTARKVGEIVSVSENAARKKLTRLARRTPGLVQHCGTISDDAAWADGTTRWELTPAGHQLVGYKSRVESQNGDGRQYTVLEQTALSDLVFRLLEKANVSVDTELVREALDAETVFAVAGEVTARNTDHAFRQIAKDVYAQRDCDDDEIVVPSVAVDGKRWRIVPVRVRTTSSVTLG